MGNKTSKTQKKSEQHHSSNSDNSDENNSNPKKDFSKNSPECIDKLKNSDNEITNKMKKVNEKKNPEPKGVLNNYASATPPKKEIKKVLNKMEILNVENFQQKSENTIKLNKLSLKTIGGSLYQDIRKIYKFKDILGGGHFGTVRIGFKRNEVSKRKYAIKSISKKNLTEKDLDDLIKEVDIIANLDHPNIIKFFETYHDEFYFHIVMELCTGKEVFDKIVEEDYLTESKVAKIIYKVTSAINYCHANGITHRDIKPENILLESSDPDADIKLIDFGLSRKYNINEKMHTILGTPYYVAPEVLKGDYDQKCDVWSIGAITYIMLCGEPPFLGKTNNEIFKKILNDDVLFDKSKWKKTSNEAKNFIRECMNKNPEKRFSAQKALEHPWFKTLHVDVENNSLDPEILKNIKNISAPKKFKKLVLRFMVNMLSHKELKDLKKAFFSIDTDHSGKINIEELVNAFKQSNIQISPEEISKITAYSDEKGNLDYTEFLVASINQKKFIDKEKLISAFKYFDVDDSGFIDSSDVKKALLRSGKKILNSEDIEKMLSEVTMVDLPKVSLGDFLALFDYDL